VNTWGKQPRRRSPNQPKILHQKETEKDSHTKDKGKDIKHKYKTQYKTQVQNTTYKKRHKKTLTQTTTAKTTTQIKTLYRNATYKKRQKKTLSHKKIKAKIDNHTHTKRKYKISKYNVQYKNTKPNQKRKNT
jgi:hypothetical protein